MARQTRPLTATEIKNTKPKEKKYTFSDLMKKTGV
jgi:hypothetical protein